MDIGSVASEALGLLPVPFIALDTVRDPSADRDDLRVAWANPRARTRFGDDIEGAWLDRDQPLGAMEPIAPEAALGRRSGRLRVVERAVERDGAVARALMTFDRSL